jgi:hypothetical protein
LIFKSIFRIPGPLLSPPATPQPPMKNRPATISEKGGFGVAFLSIVFFLVAKKDGWPRTTEAQLRFHPAIIIVVLLPSSLWGRDLWSELLTGRTTMSLSRQKKFKFLPVFLALHKNWFIVYIEELKRTTPPGGYGFARLVLRYGLALMQKGDGLTKTHVNKKA